MKTRYFAIVMIVASACGDDPAEPVLREDLTGSWQFEQIVANQTEAVACVLRGIAMLRHTGATVAGDLDLQTSECTYLIDGGAPGGPVFGSAPIDFGSSLTNGTLANDMLSVSSAYCSYEGILADDPASIVEGPVSCTLTIPGEYSNVTVAGTWSMRR